MSTALEMAAVESGGVISEDVVRRLFNITAVERPFIDSIGGGSAHNFKKEFTDKVLQSASSTNSFYENQDLSAIDDTNYGLRYYNYCQQMGKVIKMSQRGRDVRTTYDTDEFLQQLMDAGEELRRNEEAAACSRNAATPEVANTSGALMAGVATWCIHNTDRGTNGADAQLDGATNEGGGPVTPPAAGQARGLTETLFRQALRLGWNDGAEFTHVMSTADMIETIANYMFTASSRTATIRTDAPQGNRTGAGDGNGAGGGGIVAQGAVNLFVGNFGTVILTPNRQCFPYDSSDGSPVPVVDLVFFDSRYGNMSYLSQYQSKPLGEQGLYDQHVLFCDSCYIPEATRSITTIADLDPTVAMTT